MRRSLSLTLSLSMALVAACASPRSHDDDDDFKSPGAPTAQAGADQTVSSGETVVLDGTGSFDEDGLIVGFAWTQTAGAEVELEDDTLGTARFVAPASGDAPLTLTFKLTVTDNMGKKGDDTVTVTVLPESADPIFGVLADAAYEPENFVVSGGKAFFTSRDPPPMFGRPGDRDRLWVSDGTRAGTTMLKEMNAEGDGSVLILTAFKGGIVFSGSDASRQDALWFSDGTVAGTRLIKDITASTAENVVFVGVGGERFYFLADDGVHGSELWASDGTTDGTYMIADHNPHGGTGIERPTAATYCNGHFYFYAWHWEKDTLIAYPQFFRTNGTKGHLEQLTTSDRPGSVLQLYDMIVFQDRLFFTWHDQSGGIELWVTDGTREGTRLFMDIAPGVKNGWPSRFHLLGDKLLFFANEGDSAYGSLWSSDGTSSGTQVISQVDVFPSVVEEMPYVNGSYYFAGLARDEDTVGLWKTDGTPAGTRQVGSVRPETVKMEVLGDRLLFIANDGVKSWEPWVSDGTDAGTHILKDIHPDGQSIYYYNDYTPLFSVRGDKAYFVATVGDDNYQLFETDGTEAGTRIIAPEDATVTEDPMGKDSDAWGRVSDPMAPPTVLGDSLLFKANFHGSPVLYRY